LDGFKPINDTLGHKAGDEALVTIAKRLVGALRKSDTVARLGGDEFAVILEDCTVQPVSRIAEKLLVSIRQPIELESKQVGLSASIGISGFPKGGNITAGDWLAQADEAMYEAKRAGKNQYRLFAQKHQRVA
jgi:diguanylate cyclase (GGDEF)-like protein